MDNTKLIARAISWLRADDKFPRVDANDMVQELAVALEAAEAELTRRDTVIERIRSGVARRLDQDWDDTQLIETPVWNALDWIDRIIADHREAVAAAPVSLEAVKAETTTEQCDGGCDSAFCTARRPVSTEGDNRG